MSAMDAACKRITEAGFSLTDQVVRDPQNNATVLHVALLQDKWDVSKYLLESNSDDRLLDDVYTVTGPTNALVLTSLITNCSIIIVNVVVYG